MKPKNIPKLRILLEKKKVLTEETNRPDKLATGHPGEAEEWDNIQDWDDYRAHRGKQNKRDWEKAYSRLKRDWEGIKEFAKLFKEDPWKAWSQIVSGQRNDPFFGPRDGMSNKERRKLPAWAKIPHIEQPAVDTESPEHKEAMTAAYRRWFPKMSKKIDDAHKRYMEMAKKVDDADRFEFGGEQTMGLDPEGQSLQREGDESKNFYDGWKSFLTEGGARGHFTSVEKESLIDSDTLAQFIADQGGAQEALNHAEEALEYLQDEIATMREMREAISDLIADENRQEINDMMDEEDEEIEFSKKWNAGEDR